MDDEDGREDECGCGKGCGNGIMKMFALIQV